MNKRELYEANMNLQLEDLKKSATIAWDELDKSHAARAKLHDELVIAEGQRDQWKMRAETAEETFTLAVARADEFEREYLRVTREYMHLHAERDALLTVYEAAEVFVDMPRLVTESALRDAVTTFRALAVQPSTDTWEDTRARCS